MSSILTIYCWLDSSEKYLFLSWPSAVGGLSDNIFSSLRCLNTVRGRAELGSLSEGWLLACGKHSFLLFPLLFGEWKKRSFGKRSRSRRKNTLWHGFLSSFPLWLLDPAGGGERPFLDPPSFFSASGGTGGRRGRVKCYIRAVKTWTDSVGSLAGKGGRSVGRSVAGSVLVRFLHPFRLRARSSADRVVGSGRCF